jgi:predicted aspartyl protease
LQRSDKPLGDDPASRRTLQFGRTLLIRGDVLTVYSGFSLGETYIEIKIRASPAEEASQELKLLVGTGATYSWISGDLLTKLGVRSTRKARFKTIKGDVVIRDVGHVFAEYEGEAAPTTVVFAEEGDANVFGLHGLESLGLEVDPATMRVRRSEALLAL